MHLISSNFSKLLSIELLPPVLTCCIFLQAYEERRLTDPDFYRDANSLAYGKTVDDPAAAIDRMVGELNDQCALESCTLYDDLVCSFGS